VCGRFTLKTPVADWLESLFPSESLRRLIDISRLSGWSPRFNIAPTQPILILRKQGDGTFCIEPMRWGLVPAWADSLQSAYSMFNARSETLLEKSSFKHLVQTSRCTILADGYYEWQATGAKVKTPYWIHAPGDRPFGMAGLWTSNHRVHSGHDIRSATVITVPANEDTCQVHDRMPAMQWGGEEILHWLADRADPRDAAALSQELAPSPAGSLECRRVSRLVNRVQVDSPELISPETDLLGESI
jgi:putative SOS response-associated peptidase YedK